MAGTSLKGARVVVQGFGAVGSNAARFLVGNGAVLVAASDSKGGTVNPHGLDIEELTALKHAGRSVSESVNGKAVEKEALIGVECEIWIPAARPDVIHEHNVGSLRTRMVVQGANIPVTPGAEEYLYRQGILSVPDFIANAGGVICAAMEYHGETETQAMKVVGEKIRRNTRQVLDDAKRKQVPPREAAIRLATERIRKAMGFRRFSLFSSAPHFL
jgi:glutamate dehydrogenase (NAD(P)+)